MRVIASAISEIWHLFVEDGPFAAAIVLWPCLIWVFDRRAQLAGTAGSAMLAVGMIVILVAGALRHRHPRRPT
ncbi:MAG TPA: hypothetical protein VGI78_27575 [Acetobacteraceae bacterium]